MCVCVCVCVRAQEGRYALHPISEVSQCCLDLHVQKHLRVFQGLSRIKWLTLKVVLFSKLLSDEVQTLHDLKAWIRSCVQGGIRL